MSHYMELCLESRQRCGKACFAELQMVNQDNSHPSIMVFALYAFALVEN